MFTAFTKRPKINCVFQQCSLCFKLFITSFAFFLDFWTLKMEPIGCPETSLRNCHYAQYTRRSQICSLLHLTNISVRPPTQCLFKFGEWRQTLNSIMRLFCALCTKSTENPERLLSNKYGWEMSFFFFRFRLSGHWDFGLFIDNADCPGTPCEQIPGS